MTIQLNIYQTTEIQTEVVEFPTFTLLNIYIKSDDKDSSGDFLVKCFSKDKTTPKITGLPPRTVTD